MGKPCPEQREGVVRTALIREVRPGLTAWPETPSLQHLQPQEVNLSEEEGLWAELRTAYIPSCPLLHRFSFLHWRAGNERKGRLFVLKSCFQVVLNVPGPPTL